MIRGAPRGPGGDRAGQAPPPRRRDEAGGATPFVVMCIGLLLLVGLAGGWVGAVLVAHRQTQSAADLAALAGAAALQRGDNGCAAARSVATRNDVRLLSCAVAGQAVRVEVVREGPPLVGRRPTLRALARAGPVAGDDD